MVKHLKTAPSADGKRWKVPHTFTIVFFILLAAAVLTWIIPGGEYVREVQEVNGAERTIVVPGSYHPVERAPQSWQVLSAFFRGFVDKADIIVFILMVGGAFWMLNQSRAIEAGMAAFLRWSQRIGQFRPVRIVGVNNLILSLVFIIFSLFGAVFGMSEETIAFVVIFVPMAISMGYDSIVGLGICYMAAHIGFSGAMLNPFTIGIAQGISGLPLFSGLEYRFICWIFLTLSGLTLLLLYAHRIKKNPHKSPVYKWDHYWRQRLSEEKHDEQTGNTPRIAWLTWIFLSAVTITVACFYPLTTIEAGASSFTFPILPILAGLLLVFGMIALRRSVHFFILTILFFTIFYLVVGVLGYGWYVMEIATLFLAMGLSAAVASGVRGDAMAQSFLEGAKDILTPALIVGLASGIIVIMQEGKIIDTVLYGLSQAMTGAGEVASTGLMYVFQTALNLVMPSGSAKAALTMPLMSQLSDLIHVSRQTTVLAFQFGDGFTNMITPTSGVLLACLGMAKIPYTVWVRWVFKYILFFIICGFLLLLPTLFFQINGF